MASVWITSNRDQQFAWHHRRPGDGRLWTDTGLQRASYYVKHTVDFSLVSVWITSNRDQQFAWHCRRPGDGRLRTSATSTRFFGESSRPHARRLHSELLQARARACTSSRPLRPRSRTLSARMLSRGPLREAPVPHVRRLHPVLQTLCQDARGRLPVRLGRLIRRSVSRIPRLSGRDGCRVSASTAAPVDAAAA